MPLTDHRIMRKLTYILILLAAGLLPASAQFNVYAQSSDDELTLDCTIMPSKPAGRYAYVITPMICGAKDTLRLDPTVIRGKRNARLYRRAMRLSHKGEAPQPYMKASDICPIRQTVILNRKSACGHMLEEPLTFCYVLEREGCCKVETLSVECSEPITYKAPEPTYTPVVAPVPDFAGVAGVLQTDNPVLEHISNYRPYDSTRILRKEKGALYVHFPVDKMDLRPDFRDNAPTLDKIVDITRRIMADSTSRVEKIQIIGLASVEGPQARNLQLGQGRANALKEYVQARVATPDALYECVNGGEAWTELRDQINDSASPYREQMLDIIDNEPNLDKREAQLKALDKGRAYAYLRDNILSDQRNSGYVRIYFDYVPDAAAATINRASELIAREQYDEALCLLRTVQTDERAQNALGVALYMTGNREEAISCFRAAAAAGNQQAKENLKNIEH